MKLNHLVTLERGRLSWFRYPTHDIGTYLGRGATVDMFVVTVSTEQRLLVNRAASRNMLSLLLTLRPKPVSPLLKPQLVIFIPSYPSTIATNWSKVIESESIYSSFPRSLSSRLKAHDLVQVAVLRQCHHPGHRVRKLLIQLLVQAE